MPKPKVDHSNTVCCKCGNRGTYMNGHKPMWFYDRDNKHDRTGKYVCYYCYYKIDRNKIGVSKHEREHTICCICGSNDTYVNISLVPDWRRYHDENGNWNRKSYVCRKCYYIVNYDALWRNGLLSRYSTVGKGLIGTDTVAITIGVDNLNIKMNNFNWYVDLSICSKYGYSEVKTSGLDIEYNRWLFSVNRPQEYDTIFLLCMDYYSPWKYIERAYTVPKKHACWQNKKY